MTAIGNWGAQGSRRPRQQDRRRHRVEFSLAAGEFEALQEAAGRAGLARGAYAAQVVLAHIGASATGPEALDREALGELVLAAGLVRKIGVNLNQAVKVLNATGQRPGELDACARICMDRVDRLDAAAEQVRKAIR